MVKEKCIIDTNMINMIQPFQIQTSSSLKVFHTNEWRVDWSCNVSDHFNLCYHLTEVLGVSSVSCIQGQSRQTDLKKTLIRPSKTHF